jgi:hypothetical protein
MTALTVMATNLGRTRCRSRKKGHCYGQVSIHLSIAGQTHHNGGGHTFRREGAGSMSEDSSQGRVMIAYGLRS